jgi:hypothetical protein
VSGRVGLAGSDYTRYCPMFDDELVYAQRLYLHPQAYRRLPQGLR